jgi:hypothetical protein
MPSLDCFFRRINHLVVKNHLLSSSDVHLSHVGHSNNIYIMPDVIVSISKCCSTIFVCEIYILIGNQRLLADSDQAIRQLISYLQFIQAQKYQKSVKHLQRKTGLDKNMYPYYTPILCTPAQESRTNPVTTHCI